MSTNKINDFSKKQMWKLVKLMLGWVILLFLFILWLKKGSGLSPIEQEEYLLSWEFIVPFFLVSMASLVTMDKFVNAKEGKGEDDANR